MMSEIWMWLTSKSSRASIWLCRMGIPFSSFSTVMVRMAPSALIQIKKQSQTDSHLHVVSQLEHLSEGAPVGLILIWFAAFFSASVTLRLQVKQHSAAPCSSHTVHCHNKHTIPHTTGTPEVLRCVR